MFCSYNFVLNEAPNNNDVKRVANNVFNEAPNSNDATRVGINVRLTAVGVQQLSMASIYSHHAEKLTYQRPEIMTREQERFVRTEINFALGKNGGYIPSSLGGRSISV